MKFLPCIHPALGILLVCSIILLHIDYAIIIATLGLMGYSNTGLMGRGGRECCGMKIKRNNQQTHS